MGFVADLLGISSKPNIQTSDYAHQLANQQGNLGLAQGNQENLIQALTAMASGQGPSLAQTQLQNAQQQNATQAAGLIGSQKGMNPALAAKQILGQYGMANQNAANQSAQLREQEQLGALGQLGNVTNEQVAGTNQAMNIFSQGLQGQNAAQTGNSQFNAKQTGGLLGGIANAGASVLGLTEGGMVDGEEEVSGDSPKNDNVPAMLSAGEIVVPKEVVEGRPEDAAKFIEAIKAHKDDGNPQGYAKVLAAHRHLHERVSALESHMKGKGKK